MSLSKTRHCRCQKRVIVADKNASLTCFKNALKLSKFVPLTTCHCGSQKHSVDAAKYTSLTCLNTRFNAIKKASLTLQQNEPLSPLNRGFATVKNAVLPQLKTYRLRYKNRVVYAINPFHKITQLTLWKIASKWFLGRTLQYNSQHLTANWGLGKYIIWPYCESKLN